MPFFNKSTPNIPKHPEGIPVSVIVNFATDGRFKPVMFRHTEADQTEVKVNIDRIKSFTDYGDRITFVCIVKTANYETEVLLDFLISECRWLFRS